MSCEEGTRGTMVGKCVRTAVLRRNRQAELRLEERVKMVS